jgi:hypothetical protein
MGYHYDPKELFPLTGNVVDVMRKVLRREPEPELVERVSARRGMRSDEQPDDHGLRAAGGGTVGTTSPQHAPSANVVRGVRHG